MCERVATVSPDLAGAFECAALVGAGGDGNERPMDAMIQAVGPLNQAGECNAGFIRDDAILVVTFITDESEDESGGTPASWKQALLDAKSGTKMRSSCLAYSEIPMPPAVFATTSRPRTRRGRASSPTRSRMGGGRASAPPTTRFAPVSPCGR